MKTKKQQEPEPIVTAKKRKDVINSISRVLNEIEVELDVIREIAKTDDKAFEYQNILYTFKKKLNYTLAE